MRTTAISILVVLACTENVWAAPLGARVPPDALIYVGWRGGRDMGPGYATSHFKAVLDASNLSAVFETLLPQLVEAVEREEGHDNAVGLDLIGTLVTSSWSHPSAFYLGPLRMSDRGPLPEFAFLFEAGPDAADLKTKLELMLTEIDLPFAMLVDHHYDVVSLATQQAAEKIVGIGGNAQASIKADRDFQAALKQVSAEPTACVYVNIEAIVRMVGDMIAGAGPEAAMWPKIRDALGLDGLRRFVWTGEFHQDSWLSRAFIEAPSPRRGLVFLLDGKPLDADATAALPAGCHFASIGHLDLGKVYDELRDRLAEIEPNQVEQFDMMVQQVSAGLGMDLRQDMLGALGDTWVTYVDPAIGGVSQSVLVVQISLRDIQKARTAIENLAAIANGMLTMHGGEDVKIRIKQLQTGPLRVHYAALPFFTPAWTVHDGTLHAALYPQVVVAAANRDVGKTSGLVENPAFKLMWQQLGVPRASGFAWTDLKATASQGYGTVLMLERIAMGMADIFGLDAPAMVVPPLPLIQKHLTPSLQVSWADESGWHAKSLSPFPLAGLLSVNASGLALGQTAMAAGIALPALGAARANATQVVSVSSVRQILVGLHVYAAEFGQKFPPDLGVLAEKGFVPQVELFLHRSRRHEAGQANALPPAQKRQWINVNTDYIYVTPNLDLDNDRITPDLVVVYEKPRFATRGTVAVGFADGHVVRMPVEEAIAKANRTN